MKIKMNKQLQNIIIAVQAYKKWIIAEDRAEGKWNEKTDYDQHAYIYYLNLCDRLPFKQASLTNGIRHYDHGLNTTRTCFNAIISYPIEKTFSTETDELSNFEFGY